MLFKKENPATRAACRVPNSLKLTAVNVSENSPYQPEIQELRTAWLARRSGLPLSIAAALAPLVFNTEAAR